MSAPEDSEKSALISEPQSGTWGLKDVKLKAEDEVETDAPKQAPKSKSHKKKARGATPKQKPSSDIQAFATELKHGELPDGWRIEKKVRQNGNTAGTSDTYYVSPDGRKCRSMIEVAKYLAGGSEALSRAGAKGSSAKKAKKGAANTPKSKKSAEETESEESEDDEDDEMQVEQPTKTSPPPPPAVPGARRSGRASKQVQRFEAISSTAHVDRLYAQGLLTTDANEGMSLKKTADTRKSKPKGKRKSASKSLKAKRFDTVYPSVWVTLGFRKPGKGRKIKKEAHDEDNGQDRKKKKVLDDATVLRLVQEKKSKKEYINERVRLVDGKPVHDAIGTMVPKFKAGMIQQVRYTRGDLYYDLSHGLLTEEGGRAGRWKNVRAEAESGAYNDDAGADEIKEEDMDWEDEEEDEEVQCDAAPDATKYKYVTDANAADCVNRIAMVSAKRYGRTKADQRLIILKFNDTEGAVVAHFEVYNITQHAAMDWECSDLFKWVTEEMASEEEVQKAKEVCVPDPLEGVFKMYDSDEEFDEERRVKNLKKKRARQQQHKEGGGGGKGGGAPKKRNRAPPKLATAKTGGTESAVPAPMVVGLGVAKKRMDKAQLYANTLSKKNQGQHPHMQKAEQTTGQKRALILAKFGAATYPTVWTALGFKDKGSGAPPSPVKDESSGDMPKAESPAKRLRHKRSGGLGTGEDLTTFTIIQHRILTLLPQSFAQHDEICSHCYEAKGQREEVEGEDVVACSFCNEVYHPRLECLGPTHFPLSKHESSWAGNDEWCCPKCFADARSKYARRFFDNYDEDENDYQYSSDEDDDWQCLGYGGVGAPVNQTHNVKHDIPLSMLPPGCAGEYVKRRQEKGEDVDDKKYKKEKEEEEAKAAEEEAKNTSPKKGGKQKKAPLAKLMPQLEYDLIYEALERISIPVNESRFNVKINAQQELLGMCIGCVNGRSRGVIASVHTYRLRYLSTLLVEFGRRALPPGFKFTSIQVRRKTCTTNRPYSKDPIQKTLFNRPLHLFLCTIFHTVVLIFAPQVNKNYLSAMHVDKGNVGPSYIVGVGDFKGGKLWVHRQKYALRKDIAAQGYTPDGLASMMTKSTDGTVRGWDMPWDSKIGGKAECFPVHNKWELFDGNMPHCTLPYAGTRYTFIYFIQRSHHKIDTESKNFLEKEVGFPFPPPTLQKPPYPKQVARLTAAVECFAKWKTANPEEIKPIGDGGENAGKLGMEEVGALPPTATSTGSLRTEVKKVEESVVAAAANKK
jgi:hypothetical protein